VTKTRRRTVFVRSSEGGRRWVQSPGTDAFSVASIKPSGVGKAADANSTTRSESSGASLGAKLKSVVVDRVGPGSWDMMRERVVQLDNSSFMNRQFDEERLAAIFTDPKGINLVLRTPGPSGKIIGIAYGGPLERKHFSDLEELHNDPNYGGRNTLYWAGLAVDNEFAKDNFGSLLLDLWLKTARSETHGLKPYEHVSFRTESGSSMSRALARRGATYRLIPKGFNLTKADMQYGQITL